MFKRHTLTKRGQDWAIFKKNKLFANWIRLKSYTKRSAHQRRLRSQKRRRKACSCRCTSVSPSGRPWGSWICCRGTWWPCSCSRRCRRCSPCSRRSATWRGCSGGSRTGTVRCGRAENLEVKVNRISKFLEIVSTFYLKNVLLWSTRIYQLEGGPGFSLLRFFL